MLYAVSLAYWFLAGSARGLCTSCNRKRKNESDENRRSRRVKLVHPNYVPNLILILIMKFVS